MIIESYIHTGNSFPIVISHNGQKYFVKIRAGMSGKYSLINEWIGNKLGSELGISTQAPCWINLDEDIVISDINVEVRELIQKSYGLNIGFEFKDDTKEISIEGLERIKKEVLAEIFLFDIIMLNIDRSPTNLNLMDVKGEIFSVDYESALFVQNALEGSNLLQNKQILTCFRTSPIYQEIDEVTLNTFLERIKLISIQEILSEIPHPLLSDDQRSFMEQYFNIMQSKDWYLPNVINQLKTIAPVTYNTRAKMVRENQEKFRETLKQFSLKNGK